jgi:DNA ligase (NAD+)
MDINIAEATIEQLFKAGMISNISDLYNLKKEDLLKLERFADKSAENLIKSIENSKKKAFPKVLYSLGIRYVGETIAKIIAKNINSIDEIIDAEYDKLTSIDEVGERIASSIIKYFSDSTNLEIIKRLKDAGLQLANDTSMSEISDKLLNLTIVISGSFKNHSRDEIKNIIEQNGGKNASSISSKTNFLLAGEGIGPKKLEKANNLKIKIISESEFEDMIE